MSGKVSQTMKTPVLSIERRVNKGGIMRIGIDPGVSGAIAFLNGTEVEVVDMPVMLSSKNKSQVNAAELAKILKGWVYPTTLGDFYNLSVYVERVGAMPGQGVVSMFNFGVSYGIILGVLGALQLPVILISPVKWKRRAGLIGKPKDYARTLAQQLYPGIELGRKKDIGRADALLIARFGEV